MNRLFAVCIAFVLIFSAGSASAQWNVEYMQDPDIDFNGVCFPSSTVGYAVGSGGAIFKTTNGGEDWIAQTSPTALSLFDVFFTSTTDGFAVGDNGVMIYTNDGTNWYVHAQSQVLTTADLNSVYFVDSYAWTGGDSEDIFRSTDSGATWYLSAALGSNSEVEGISFVDTLTGYAAVDGDMIAYTTDGGMSFTLSSSIDVGPAPYSRFDMEEIFTIDDTTAIATGWGSLVGAQPTLIIISEDAGETWDIANADYHWDTYTYGFGITMFDDGELMIVGGGSGCPGILLHSTDGYNWTTSAAFTGETLNDVAAIPGTNTVVAVGAGGFIARSTDKGYTWSYMGTPSWGFAGWQKYVAYGNRMYGVGDGGLFGVLEHDGSSWTGEIQTIAVDNFVSRLYDVAVFPEDGIIYACGSQGSFYRSNDMGASWTMLEHSFSATDGFWGMHWFDKDNGVLVGELGGDDVIYTTTNGGDDLTQVWLNVTTQQLNSVSFAPGSSTIGVAVGDNMGIVYTTDGGANWAVATEDVVSTLDDLEEVHMVTATDGWAVGDNGTIVKTTDGGANWAQQPTWTTVTELNDVYFNNPGFGWICGNAGECHYTDDGGTTWNDINTTAETGNDINTIYMQGALGILWAGGDYFVMLTDDNPVVTDVDPISIPFALEQNYPNPFNPSTTIRFTISQKGFVSLNIFDVAGRMVAKVVNREMDEGDHAVNFQANGLSSGVYFYRLETGDEVQTRKMILLR
ncbi:MAG: T9SS type A sorting domain-containing protein [Candidatus Krumholzibacteriota bacterium]|nr:T9SS type A sorting domain-containing protein [Candidatus Krumholzibacteriota bacterium]